ncbi:MAG: hypothetical protein J4400_00495 [Candidatus Aenigmarchaeota archaeon]|nr:hypothetical protein [Candidatus Aenigmarchaeota archaeon]
MSELHRLGYSLRINGRDMPAVMDVVLETDGEMEEVLGILPPVDLPDYMAEKLALFSPEGMDGVFVMVAYRGHEGPAYVSHYFGMHGDYEMCMSSVNGSGVESYRGRCTDRCSAAIHKERAEVHLAHAPRILSVQGFLAGMNL